MQKESLLKGTAVLGSALLIAKLIGLIYRLILPNMVGTQVMGLYGMAYSVYTVLLTLSMAGIPVAISKLISGYLAVNDPKGAKRVFKIAFVAITSTGLLFTLILFLGAEYIAENITGDPRAYLSLQAVAPAIFIVAIMSSFRGYFQGMQQMTKTAVSQVLEQLLRVAGIILFAYLLLPIGTEYAAAGAAFGNVIGSFTGLCYLFVSYIRNPLNKKESIINKVKIEEQNEEKAFNIIKKIAYLSFPIIIGNLIMPLMNLIDATVVVNRLTGAGISQYEATAMFAHLTQYANPLIMFPGTLGMALSMSLVPAISESMAKNYRQQAENRGKLAIRFAILIGLPSTLGMFILSEPIINLIFPRDPEAAIVLRYLSFAILFLILKFATTGILQGMGKTMLPVKNLFIGAIIKLIVTFFLTSIPEINVKGAAFGTVLAHLLATGLNYRDAKKYLNFKILPMADVIKPVISSLGMSLAVIIIFWLMNINFSQNIATILSIGFGVLIYLILLLGLKVVEKDEIHMIPRYGPKFVKLLEKAKVW
ncbi:putative polysaccharide biosynthesis protein [Natranaerofaba carboxydovora]|uniref:putative polysaccharide biosynthesis protein n=1 Tax=Natranaerofaba carboxydovora TaxID=2742683 RepID=UPI001F13A98E|nr:polysaccharide biosynthesis protein [Natranaerofaba carboxydovora]UMZ75202.1 Stage V sporulation protein B [Natranaerofaba carboxydovora]